MTFRYPRAAGLLLAAAVRAAGQEGLSAECGLQRPPRALDAPWYYHYEQGIALAPREPGRALESVAEALHQRPAPDRLARTYGIWRIEYQPYLQIARIQARLGRWECAEQALAISARLEEIDDAEEERDHLRDLQRKPTRKESR